MDVTNVADASASFRQLSRSGRQLPTTPAPSEIGRKRTSEFLHNVSEAPKSRRLDVARQIKVLEMDYDRTMNRIKKWKHQIRESTDRLEEDETHRAYVDEQIRSLKSENTDE